jgi:hypothetical protein
MDRVIAYIDGYNLYFGLRHKGWKRFYWTNLAKLAGQFLKPNQSLLETKYFTTKVSTGVLHIGHVELSKSLFPDQVARNGIILKRPDSWR